MSTDLDHPSSQITPARRAGDRTLPHIPTEIYEAIFTHLEDPSFGLAQPDDIRDTYVSLILVCRLFYTLGIPHRFRHINRINNAHDDLPYEKHESFIRAITAHPSPVSHILKLVKSVKFWGWLEEEYDEMREKYPSEYDYSALFHRQVACLGAINNLTRIDISDCRISYLLIQQIASLSTLEDVSFNSCHEWEDFPEYPAPVSMPPTPWKSFLLMESENNDYSADRQYGALFADLALSPELLSLSASVPEFFPELTPERLARLVGLKSLLIDLYSSGLRKLVEIPGQALETLTIQDPGRMYEKSPSSEDKDMIQHLSSCFPKLKSLPECPAYLVNALLPKRPVTLLHAKHFCGDPAIFATSTAGLTSLFISIEALKKGALPPLPCLVDFALHFESLRSPQYVRDCFQHGSPITRPVHPTVPVIRFEYSSDGKSPQHNLPLQHAYIVEAVQDAFPGAIKFSVWYDPGITFSEQFDYHAACVWQRRDGANEWTPRPPRDLKSLRIYLRSMSASSYRLWNGGGHGRSVFRSHVEAVDVFVDWNGYFESVFQDERAREDERAHEDELDREDEQDREANQEHDEEDKGENERDHGDDEVGEDYDDEDDECEQNYDDEDEGDPEIVMPEALRYLLERGAQHPVAFDDSVDGSNEHD